MNLHRRKVGGLFQEYWCWLTAEYERYLISTKVFSFSSCLFLSFSFLLSFPLPSVPPSLLAFLPYPTKYISVRKSNFGYMRDMVTQGKWTTILNLNLLRRLWNYHFFQPCWLPCLFKTFMPLRLKVGALQAVRRYRNLTSGTQLQFSELDVSYGSLSYDWLKPLLRKLRPNSFTQLLPSCL